jgi:hypothetical protein
MKKCKGKFLASTSLLMAIVMPLLAQNEGRSFSGFIDASYNYNFSKGTTNTLRSYDARANQINLNNAHFAVSGTPSKKLAYTAEADFGSDAAVHGLLNQPGGSAPIGVDLQEAYLTYSFSDKVSFTGGKFVTFEGIELIEGPSNPTVSRGYLYGLAEPFCHVGGYVTLLPSSHVDFKIGVVNGWDLLVDNNRDKTIISRVGVNLGDPLSFGISYLLGVEQVNSNNWRHSLDLTGVTKVFTGVAVNFQANYGTESFSQAQGGTSSTKWFGFGIQPVLSLCESLDLGCRIEYFADDQGARTGIPDLNAINVTLTPALKLEGATFRLEYRFDNSNKEVFVKDLGLAKNSNTVSFEIYCNL